MALFTANIILRQPQIVVSDTNALQGVKSGGVYKYGLVQMIYMGCLETFVDQTVLYDSTNSISINYGSRKYWIIKETDIIFYDTIPVGP